MSAGAGGTREWLRRWRVYLVLLPLTLALGIGTDLTYAVQQRLQPEVVDVPRGQVVRYQGFSLELTGVAVGQSVTDAQPPARAVAVVASFRGRIDDPDRASGAQCVSVVENRDGLEWKDRIRPGDLPYDGGYDCSGRRFTVTDGVVRAQPGEWYEFRYEYWVREERATGLRPVISFRSDAALLPYARLLRFGS